MWITESDSVRRLCQISGYSSDKIQRIKDYWLTKTPDEKVNYSRVEYLIYDATYFHKEGCLLNLMDAERGSIIAHRWVQKESFRDAFPWFLALRQEGLNPLFITTDGERSLMRAMRLVWPKVKLQRCLYHIKHEGMRWLRTYPRTEAGRELRAQLSVLCSIKTIPEKDEWITQYYDWVKKYEKFILALPRSTVAFRDLKKTMHLINYALGDMFYYLENPSVNSTTNALEGFHSQLKADYQRHRGLSKEHRLGYIHWYCYYHNNPD